MNTQQFFNRVWKWFILQKHPKSVTDDACAYYIDDDHRCAIGCAVPKKMAMSFDTVFQKRGIGGVTFVIEETPGAVSYFKNISKTFLKDLQFAHDTTKRRWFHKQLEIELRAIATKYNLDIPIS